MTDSDIENLLRKYRPVGPPARLRERILARAAVPRIWPWAVVAAALLVSALALHAAAGYQAASANLKLRPDAAVRAADDLTEVLGGDASARQVAEFILVEQRMRSEQVKPVSQGATVPGGELR